MEMKLNQIYIHTNMGWCEVALPIANSTLAAFVGLTPLALGLYLSRWAYISHIGVFYFYI
jgi:hypothetical protein